MLLDLRLTKINPNMSFAVVECVYLQPGSQIKPGDKLFDLSVDLSSGFSQYCPPISYFRIVSRERALIKELLVSPGTNVNVGELLAMCSSVDDGAGEGPTRPLRVTTAGIAHNASMWSAKSQ
jgi:pyruvate/2-oxoglutarate dehydrogenase complex dihydrolipoamide acyltransferase (E2) component